MKYVIEAIVESDETLSGVFNSRIAEQLLYMQRKGIITRVLEVSSRPVTIEGRKH